METSYRVPPDLAALLAQAEAARGEPFPRSRPPRAPDAPLWVNDIREQYAATGFVSNTTMIENLKVGESLLGPFGGYTKVAADALQPVILPFDPDRPWHVK